MTKSLLGRVIRPALLGCGLGLLLGATAGMASAHAPVSTPEIGPDSMAGALALLAGGLLVLRSRWR
jgi:hypothetical protein